jgi:Alginate export
VATSPRFTQPTPNDIPQLSCRSIGRAIAVSRRCIFCGLIAGLILWRIAAAATDEAEPATDEAPTRPSIQFNRWQEDWSVLADSRVPREPLDSLKYIPLSADDPEAYLSFGANLRERFEANDAAGFGTGPNRNADYDISRLEVFANLRLGPQFQFFTELQSDYAIGKQALTPVDQDRPVDLEQAFIVLIEPLDDGLLKIRLGRQQFAVDLQRFISFRDGPNVRLSFDAAWVEYERKQWSYIAFYSRPVQDRDLNSFDDYSTNKFTFDGLRVARKVSDSAEVSAYYARYMQDDVAYPTVSGNERRDILELHFSGTKQSFDWDVEAMNQTGQIGGEPIEAWGVGSVVGYTITKTAWTPRLGIQLDAASGNRNPDDRKLNTFNPLFPNGYYVTLAGYTGYVNFIHIKPSVTVHPTHSLQLIADVGMQWRETTADAVYLQPNIPVPDTAGRPGRYTGTYGQFRTDYMLSSHISLALEVVHFTIAESVRDAGGHDSDYVGAEFKFGW